MRKALNENPLVQVGAIGILALLVGAMFLMRMGGGSEPAPSAGESASAAAPAATDAAPTDAASAPPDAAGVAAPAADVAAAVGAGAAAPESGGFEAGPGLPEPVVSAYDAGKIVALLVVRENGIDDRELRTTVEGVRARSDTALFVVNAKRIAKYSRIAQGVDVDRTPALVVLTPKPLADGPLPTATVEYGFRGPKSVEQALDDAAYKGPSDLPYYPR